MVVVLRLMVLFLRFLVVFLVAGMEEEVFWLNSFRNTGVILSAVTHWLCWLLSPFHLTLYSIIPVLGLFLEVRICSTSYRSSSSNAGIAKGPGSEFCLEGNFLSSLGMYFLRDATWKVGWSLLYSSGSSKVWLSV